MKVKFSTLSLKKLSEIDEYISVSLNNPKAAINILREVKSKASLLCDFPELGKKLDVLDGLFFNYRFLPVDKYIVVYKIEEDNILIETIIDSRTNEFQLLFKNNIW